MHIELLVDSFTSPSLRLNGELHQAPITLASIPLFALSARPGWPASFQVAKGNYQLEFYVKYGSGKFKVHVREFGKDIPLATKECDTATGYLGMSMKFEVL